MFQLILFSLAGSISFADLKVQTTTVTTIKPATVTQVGPPIIPTVAPVVYGSAAIAAQQAAIAAAAARAAAPANSNPDQGQQALQKMLQSMGQGGGGAGGSGAGGTNNNNSAQRYRPQSADSTAAPSGQEGQSYVEPGKIDSCAGGAGVPAKVTQALQQAKDFRDKCRAANRGAEQKIAINDYSCDGTPKMWIFDAQGKCISSTAVTFGTGGGRSAGQNCPLACADGGQEMTPPGFHLTGVHGTPTDGKKYNASNSMELVSLEDQGSHGRGILIHKAAAPGTASSWGCSGVCFTCFNTIAKTLGYGALVYNYFGDSPQAASGCKSQAGLTHNPSTCAIESGVSIPNGAPPTSSDAVSLNLPLMFSPDFKLDGPQ